MAKQISTHRKKSKKRSKRTPVNEVHNRFNLDAIEKIFAAGLIDRQIAIVCGISERTLYRYEHNPKFKAVVQQGKKKAVEAIESSLFKRASGYNFAEITMEPMIAVHQEDGVKNKSIVSPELQITKTVIKHIPADPEMVEFYLANRAPEEWKRKLDLTSGGEKINVPTFVVPAFGGNVVRLPSNGPIRGSSNE